MKLLYYIWLGSKLQAGSGSPKILLEYYDCDVEKIYNASEDDYLKLQLSKGDIKKLSDKDLTDAKRYYEYCAKERIGILCYDSSYYPQRLKNTENPPPMFYYKGRIEMLDDYPCFAMVGTRGCSENGCRTAYRMGYEAAYRGAVVVNGIATGIDAAVLRGALDADGYVVVFLGSGIDRIYPPENTELFRKVARRGLILSEFPPFTPADGYNFPKRNRCMSGISLATVIFEADVKSGALHTARHAINQGRPVYAVPGDINDRLYEGPLDLIKQGAIPITCADDFVLEYRELFPHRIEKSAFTAYPAEKEDEAVKEAFGEKQLSQKNTVSRITLPKNKKGAKGKKSEKAEKIPIEELPQGGGNTNTNPTESETEKRTSVIADLTHLSVNEAQVIAIME
ncbi:MAG: DNA-processing protein DprA, partial [Clostridia bacterium]|nr:DNA-processing protein DprA [Clostridia bacterium]